MTSPPTPTPLRDASARRTVEAEHRVRGALRDLDRDGNAINFAAVAARARVSRAFLYEHRDFRSEIQALRTAQTATPGRPAARHSASDASLHVRLRAALDDNQRQRQEITRLRDELAITHGRVRELELDHATARRSSSISSLPRS